MLFPFFHLIFTTLKITCFNRCFFINFRRYSIAWVEWISLYFHHISAQMVASHSRNDACQCHQKSITQHPSSMLWLLRAKLKYEKNNKKKLSKLTAKQLLSRFSAQSQVKRSWIFFHFPANLCSSPFRRTLFTQSLQSFRPSSILHQHLAAEGMWRGWGEANPIDRKLHLGARIKTSCWTSYCQRKL